MKILTVGTGVIGTIYSWILAQQGHDVTHYVRKGKSAKINAHIKIDLLDKRKGYKTRSVSDYTYKLTETLAPDNDYDYIIIAVRVCQLDGLLKDLSGLTGNACCVIFTGNWHGVDFIEKYLPAGSFLFSDGIAGGKFHGDLLVATINRTLPMGEVDGSRTKRLLAFGEMFEEAKITPVYHAHILHWHWVQYALNAGMWGALVRAGSYTDVMKDKFLIREALKCTTECVEVCEKRGVDLNEFPETKTYTNLGGIQVFFLRRAFTLMMRHSEYHKRCASHGLDDPAEIKMFYDAVLQTGMEMGLAMPHYRGFQKDIEAFYHGGAFKA